MSMRAIGVAMLAIALAACATRPVSPALPAIEATAQMHQTMREAALAAVPDWSMTGRVAVSNGKDGGSGRIEWLQQGPRFDVSLSAPITRQSWRVTGGEGDAVLEGLAGGTRTGPDAGALVREATRWDIPVDALVRWVRGLGGAEAALAYGADRRLTRISEAGWTIDYADWRIVDRTGVELPGRVEATKGDARVRLVVDAWTADAWTQ